MYLLKSNSNDPVTDIQYKQNTRRKNDVYMGFNFNRFSGKCQAVRIFLNRGQELLKILIKFTM